MDELGSLLLHGRRWIVVGEFGRDHLLSGWDYVFELGFSDIDSVLVLAQLLGVKLHG